MMIADPSKARVISALWFSTDDGTRRVMLRTSPLKADVYKSNGRGIGCTVVDAPCVSVHENEPLDTNYKYHKLFHETGQTRTRTSLVHVHYILSQFNTICYAGFLVGDKFQSGSKNKQWGSLDSDDNKWIYVQTRTQNNNRILTYRRPIVGEVT